MKLRELTEAVGISKERAGYILHDVLEMKKLSARVPRLLTIDQKQQRVDDSTVGLALLQRNRADFFRRFVTMDETWVHYHTPEFNRQSAEWLKSHESRPKRPKDQRSAGKVMASVFWDAHNLHRLPAEGKNSYGRVLCSVIGQTERRNKEKTAPYGEEKFCTITITHRHTCP